MHDISPEPDHRLQRLLGGPELAEVRQRLRRYFENVEPGETSADVRIDKLASAAYAALCQLTGRPSRSARSMTVDIGELDQRLRAAGLADSLRDALERLEGPIVSRKKLRQAAQAKWSALATCGTRGRLLNAWLTSPKALALLKRVGRDPARAEQILAHADGVLRRLPCQGLPRSQLAAETLGDAHALDAGRAVASVVLAAWRWHERSNPLAEENTEAEEHGLTTKDADVEERARDVWARAGVLVNELARPALCLNLPCPGGAYSWSPGEPAYVSLRQLVRTPPTWQVAGRRIYVCENPNVVAMVADRLGATSAPLVCTDGMPAAAQRTLLMQLATAGAILFYHGDYDWPGIQIANVVIRRFAASPWHFGVADYLAALERTPSRARDLSSLTVEASWDMGLRAAMQEHGLAIAEEAVADVLLADLHRDTWG